MPFCFGHFKNDFKHCLQFKKHVTEYSHAGFIAAISIHLYHNFVLNNPEKMYIHIYKLYLNAFRMEVLEGYTF